MDICSKAADVNVDVDKLVDSKVLDTVVVYRNTVDNRPDKNLHLLNK